MNSKVMNTQSPDPNVWAKYYQEVNYGGSHSEELVVFHGDVLQLTNADGTWNKNSRSNGVNQLSMLTVTDVDISNPAQNYSCYFEDYSSQEISFFKEKFLYASHPLKTISIDSNITKRVKISLQALVSTGFVAISCPDMIAVTSRIPQTLTEITSATSGVLREGTLGFVDITQSLPTEVTVQYGYFDAVSGTANWTGSGRLNLSYQDGRVTVDNVSGLPAEWVISNPVAMPDGDWKVDISQQAPGISLFYYPETYYYGTCNNAAIVGLNDQIQHNEGYWAGKSLRVPTIRTGMLYSGITSLSQYKPENYHQVIFSEPEQPDLPSLYGAGHSTAYCFVTDVSGYFVWLNCQLSSPEYTAFFSQSYEVQAIRYASSGSNLMLTGTPDGALYGDMCTVYYGHVDADGFYINTGSGTLVVTLTDGILQISNITGFPDNWRFSTPEKQADGNWLVVLSDTI